MKLGLRRGVVRLARPDPGWRDVALTEVTRVKQSLGHLAVAVEHVGSTAVPDLLCKPIIDLVIGTPGPPDEATYRAALEPLRYAFHTDSGAQGGLVFVQGDADVSLFHIHVVAYGTAQWTAYLDFRDRLRTDASARLAYEEIKIALAAEFPQDRVAYTDGKDQFIHGLLSRV